MARGVKVTAKKIDKRDLTIRRIIQTIFIILSILLAMFIILTFVYKGGNFTISLDPNLMLKSGLIMYEKEDEEKAQKPKLFAKSMEFMDNISIKWLPNDLHDHNGGNHNGDEYIAYTFHLKNEGETTINYWYEFEIEDVIKNVDDAIRIMIYHNDSERKVYAKRSGLTNQPEPGTIEFYDEKIAVLEERKNFGPTEVDKITVVIWIEGDDPECLDNLIGGEIRASMNIVERHTEEGRN